MISPMVLNIPHGTQDNPPRYSWYFPMVLKISPHIYHDIPPHLSWYPPMVLSTPTVLKISPTVLMISPTVLNTPTVLHTLYRVILWRNVQTRGLQQFINLNEIFDGQEQQSNSNICLNQEIQYTFISSWNCDCSLWLKVKSFHENLWKQNLSKQKHHMLLLFRWFLEHHAISCWWLVSCIVSSMA